MNMSPKIDEKQETELIMQKLAPEMESKKFVILRQNKMQSRTKSNKSMLIIAPIAYFVMLLVLILGIYLLITMKPFEFELLLIPLIALFGVFGIYTFHSHALEMKKNLINDWDRLTLDLQGIHFQKQNSQEEVLLPLNEILTYQVIDSGMSKSYVRTTRLEIYTIKNEEKKK